MNQTTIDRLSAIRMEALQMAKADLLDEAESIETALRDLVMAEHSAYAVGLPTTEIRKLHGIAERKLLDVRDMISRFQRHDLRELVTKFPSGDET